MAQNGQPGASGTAHELEGFRIAVTADRRASDQCEAFERRGAEVLHAPAVRIAPVESDDVLIADTRAVIAVRPDLVIVTTAYGLRRWLDCADAAGQGEALDGVLRSASVLVRGPKARGALRAAGLEDDGIAPDERVSTTVDLALERGVAGKRVVMQLHGLADVEQQQRLEAAGASVLTVAPYRWVRPHDGSRLERLITAVAAREVDVVTFTAAPAVDALMSAAAELGLDGAVTEALRTEVTAAAVGPVTAMPLHELGVEPLVPERFRMGAMIRIVTDHLLLNGVQEAQTTHGLVRLQGSSLRLGDTQVHLARGARLVMQALLDAPGAVVSRERLLDGLPDAESEHALDMAISRLRAALPERDLVQTVVRRGYRLAV